MEDGEGKEMRVRGKGKMRRGWVYRFAGVGPPAEPLAQLVPFPFFRSGTLPRFMGLWAQHTALPDLIGLAGGSLRNPT